jgi:hypothetical protein
MHQKSTPFIVYNDVYYKFIEFTFMQYAYIVFAHCSSENIFSGKYFCTGRAIGFARNGRQDFDAQIKAACGETGTANMPGLCRAACPVCATPTQAGCDFRKDRKSAPPAHRMCRLRLERKTGILDLY